jgi:hypothetical protein
VGRTLIRTVWLGIFLFAGLVALASFKLAFGSPRPIAIAESSQMANDREIGTVVTTAVPDTLKKSDRLQVTYVHAVEPVAMVPPVPPELPNAIAQKIISRHWHDPSDQKVAQVATRKPKSSKKASPGVERKPVLEADACNSAGLDRIKRFFNPATNCKTSD